MLCQVFSVMEAMESRRLTVTALRRLLDADGGFYQVRAANARRLGHPGAALRAADVIMAAAQSAWEVQNGQGRVDPAVALA